MNVIEKLLSIKDKKGKPIVRGIYSPCRVDCMPPPPNDEPVQLWIDWELVDYYNNSGGD